MNPISSCSYSSTQPPSSQQQQQQQQKQSSEQQHQLPKLFSHSVPSSDQNPQKKPSHAYLPSQPQLHNQQAVPVIVSSDDDAVIRSAVATSTPVPLSTLGESTSKQCSNSSNSNRIHSSSSTWVNDFRSVPISLVCILDILMNLVDITQGVLALVGEEFLAEMNVFKYFAESENNNNNNNNTSSSDSSESNSNYCRTSKSVGFAHGSVEKVILFCSLAILLDISILCREKLKCAGMTRYIFIGILEMRMLLRMEVINSAETFQIPIADAIILVLTIFSIASQPDSSKARVLLRDFNMLYFVLRVEMKLNYFTLFKSILLIAFPLFAHYQRLADLKSISQIESSKEVQAMLSNEEMLGNIPIALGLSSRQSVFGSRNVQKKQILQNRNQMATSGAKIAAKLMGVEFESTKKVGAAEPSSTKARSGQEGKYFKENNYIQNNKGIQQQQQQQQNQRELVKKLPNTNKISNNNKNNSGAQLALNGEPILEQSEINLINQEKSFLSGQQQQQRHVEISCSNLEIQSQQYLHQSQNMNDVSKMHTALAWKDNSFNLLPSFSPLITPQNPSLILQNPQQQYGNPFFNSGSGYFQGGLSSDDNTTATEVLNQLDVGVALLNLTDMKVFFSNTRILEILSVETAAGIGEELFQLKKNSAIKQGDLLDLKSQRNIKDKAKSARTIAISQSNNSSQTSLSVDLHRNQGIHSQASLPSQASKNNIQMPLDKASPKLGFHHSHSSSEQYSLVPPKQSFTSATATKHSSVIIQVSNDANQSIHAKRSQAKSSSPEQQQFAKLKSWGNTQDPAEEITFETVVQEIASIIHKYKMNSRLFRSELLIDNIEEEENINTNNNNNNNNNDDEGSSEEKRMKQLREAGYTFTALNEKVDESSDYQILKVTLRLWNSTENKRGDSSTSRHKRARMLGWNSSENPVLVVSLQDITKQTLMEEQDQMNRFKLKILSSISHELRTPLNCSIVMLQMLLQSEQLVSQTVKTEYLEPAYYNNQLLYYIINDILDYAQISQNSFELKLSSFSLQQTVQDCVNIFLYSAEFKGISLQVKFDSSVPFVIMSDQERIKQVLINLLSNAVKYTTEGNVTVFVSPSPELGNIIIVSVEDTGCGIPQSMHKQIFDYMEHASNNRQDLNSNGAGFGLTISEKIVKGLSDNRGIFLESEEGLGSKFTFYIQNKEPISKSIQYGKRSQFNNVFLHQRSTNLNSQLSIDIKSIKSDISSINVRSLVTPKNNNVNPNPTTATATTANNNNILIPTSPSLSMNNLPKDDDRKTYFQIAATKQGQLIRKSSRFLIEDQYQGIRQTTLSNPSIDIPMYPSLNNIVQSSIANAATVYSPDSLQPDRIRQTNLSNYQLHLNYQQRREQSINLPLCEEESSLKSISIDHNRENSNTLTTAQLRINNTNLIDRVLIDTFSEINEDSDDYKHAIPAFNPQPNYFSNAAFQLEIPTYSKKHFKQSGFSLAVNTSSHSSRKSSIQQISLSETEEKLKSKIVRGTTSETERDDLGLTASQLSVIPSSNNNNNNNNNNFNSNRTESIGAPTLLLEGTYFGNEDAVDSHAGQLKVNNRGSLFSFNGNGGSNLDRSQDFLAQFIDPSLNPKMKGLHDLLNAQQKVNNNPTPTVSPTPPAAIAPLMFAHLASPAMNDSIDHSELNRFTESHSKEYLQQNQEELKRKLKDFYATKKCKCNRVLVVDDNQFNVLVMKKLLDSYGIEADQSFNGANALDVVIARTSQKKSSCCCPHYMLILMDIDMPVMNGYEATQAIFDHYRESFKHSVVPPVISACTAYVSNEDQAQAKKRGMKFFLRKPIDVFQLDLVLEYSFFKRKRNGQDPLIA